MYIWAEIGLALVYLNLIRVGQINNAWIQCWSGILLCFFCCPLLLAQKILDLAYNGMYSMKPLNFQWLVWHEDIALQYTSNYSMLRWVMPQILAIWLIVLLFIDNKEFIQDYVVLLLPYILFGALPFVGIVIIAICIAIGELVKTRHFGMWAKKAFSLANISTLCTFGGVLFLYFYGNVLSDKPYEISLRVMDYEGNYGIYFIFIVVMVMLYAATIFDSFKREALFYLSVASLLIIPFFRMGLYNDWGMRCSIPALFILFYYVIRFLNFHIDAGLFKENVRGRQRRQIAVFSLLILLCVGLTYPHWEFVDSIMTDNILELGEDLNFGTMEGFASRTLPEEITPDFRYNYYSYDIESNLFYKYAARSGLDNREIAE